jgi:hypothetical protein
VAPALAETLVRVRPAAPAETRPETLAEALAEALAKARQEETDD